MEIIGQSLLIVDRKSLVEEIKEGVDKRGWDGDEAKVKDSLNEDCFIPFDDRFDDFAIEASDVDTQEGPKHQEDSEKANVKHFFGLPGGYHNLYECFDSFEEDGVDVASSAFLHYTSITFFSPFFSVNLMKSVEDFLFFM